MITGLVQAGHNFLAIPDYTLQQVMILSDAVGRREAERRHSFVTDMALCVTSVLGGSEPLQEHLDSLSEAADGDKK